MRFHESTEDCTHPGRGCDLSRPRQVWWMSRGMTGSGHRTGGSSTRSEAGRAAGALDKAGRGSSAAGVAGVAAAAGPGPADGVGSCGGHGTPAGSRVPPVSGSNFGRPR